GPCCDRGAIRQHETVSRCSPNWDSCGCTVESRAPDYHSIDRRCGGGASINRSAEMSVEHYGDIRRLAKCATVSGSIHRAIDPRLCPCLRSLTTRTGCGAPLMYKRALSPRTSIFTMVHSPGIRST